MKQTGLEKVNHLIKDCFDKQRLRYLLKKASVKELREWLQWKTPLSYATDPKDTCVEAVIKRHIAEAEEF